MGLRPSGTVTFLFTDIEGSTRLWDEHPAEMPNALTRHDEILRSAIEAHDGFVFSTGGDGLAAAFPRAGDAVAAAVQAQRHLLAEPWTQPVALPVRMGLHTGEAQERDGDYFGPPLNRAARLMGAARGGQIVVTRTTADVLGSVTGMDLVDLGMHRLRGIREAIHAFGVRAEGVPWLDRPLTTAQTSVGNLPNSVNEWFGEVAALHRQVANLPKRRLVTLTGTGGVGKTRLALEAAAVAADEFADGVWLVELGPVAEPGAVASAVAATLSIRPQEGLTLVESIVDWLRGRRLLLIVDNCEHLLGSVVDLVTAIVDRCPTVTTLATSREPLGVRGERVVPVASLVSSDAVELFCDRAAATDESLVFSRAERATIADICAHLDGIPLAIELAAARVRSLTPAELLERLADRFRLLRGGSRGGLERHRTLRATVAWSYQLLSGLEQLLFDRLSGFAGEFDLAAAEVVGADAELDADDVFELLASLVDKSMVIADRREYGTRYRLLETLRQFGAERLDERAGVASIRDRHLSHFVEVAKHASELWGSPRQLAADAIFEREWDNLRAAHAWAIANTNLAAADSLVATTGRHARARMRHEHGDWAESTLCLDAGDRRPDSSSYGWAARWAVAIGDYERAVEIAHRGIRAAPSEDHPETAACWGWLVLAYVASGRGAEAVEPARHVAIAGSANSDPVAQWVALSAVIESAIANDPRSVPGDVARLTSLANRIGAPSILSETKYFEGQVALYAQNPRDGQAALDAYRAGLDLARKARDTTAEARSLLGLAVATTALRLPDAADTYRFAITRLYETRFWNLLWPVLEVVAGSFAAARNLEPAAVIYGHLELHPPWAIPSAQRAHQRGLQKAREHPQADELLARGAAMDRDQLVHYTLEQLDKPATAAIVSL